MIFCLNYTLLKNNKRIKRELTTNEIIHSYNNTIKGNPLEPQIYQWNRSKEYFDFDQTTFPITLHTLKLITTMYPNLKTIKMTLKPDTKPESFLLQTLNELRALRKLSLILTDGLKNFHKTELMIHELKLSFRSVTSQPALIRHIIEKTCMLKSLTIRSGTFSINTLKTIRMQNLKKLSIKNPIFTPLEANNFFKDISEFDLEIFKFVPIYHSKLNDNNINLQLTYQYLCKLPHYGLTEFAFTLLPSIFNYNYASILDKLITLEKMKIFIHPVNDNENLDRLIPLFQNAPKNLHITLLYIIFEDKSDKLMRKIPVPHELIKNYENIHIEYKINPYMPYPILDKKQSTYTSINKYRLAEFERKYLQTFIDARENLGKEILENLILTDYMFPTTLESETQSVSIDLDINQESNDGLIQSVFNDFNVNQESDDGLTQSVSNGFDINQGNNDLNLLNHSYLIENTNNDINHYTVFPQNLPITDQPYTDQSLEPNYSIDTILQANQIN